MIEQVAESDPPEVWAHLEAFTGAMAFDIGANAGQSAVALASRFETVHSFEPAVESLEALAAAGLPDNVHVHPWAVSDHNGGVTLVEQERHLARGQLTTRDLTVPTSFEDETHGWGKVTGTRVVECVTLSALAVMFGQPDLVKCDVEGHEGLVVDGGLDVLLGHTPGLFIEVHNASLGEYIHEMLAPVYGHRLQTVRHPNYPPEHIGWANHYWLVAPI